MAKFQKAVWGGPDYSEGPDGVARVVERLAGAGFKLIMPFVETANGTVQYHSKIADVNPAFKDWDLLAVLAEKAGKAGLKVHPCMNPFRNGLYASKKDESLHKRNRAGELLPRLCAASNAARKVKLNLYEELLERYPIAGVHLDFIRYENEDECFCESCRSLFKAETGVDPLEIGKTAEYNTFSEQATNRKHPAWARWIEWRAGWVTKFVEEISGLVRSRDKELSAAVFMDYPECLVNQGQDWADWGERGLIDYLFPMTYTNSVLMVKRRTRNHVAQIRGGCHLWEGLGKRSSRSTLSTEALVEQTKAAIGEGAGGIVIFAYSSLTDEDLSALSRMDG